MDSVKELRELAFATRLKRLSDRLTKDVSLIYKTMNFDFEARWFAIISVLKEKSPMPITDIAGSMGITHTAVNQLAEELLSKGYITSAKGDKDERQRLLSLSEKGRGLCRELAPLWEEIKRANKELIDKVDPNLLSIIGRLEDELDKLSIFERVWMNLQGSMPGKITILDYSPKMKKHFQRLNYEWLEEYFSIEEKDKSILLYPKEKIINCGGTIFFALVDDEVAGTCAVIRHPDKKFELAKMAVTKKYQTRGIGRILIDTAIEWVRDQKAQELFLLTNERLVAANFLYKKSGFVRMENNPIDGAHYQRKTYAMKLDLKQTAKKNI